MADKALQDEYVLHNENELARLTDQHRIIRDALRNQLVWAPVNLDRTPLQILDICTANGVWIRDLQGDHASNQAQHTFVGTDIEPSYFPLNVPGNTSYHVQDINKAWPVEWHERFDLIHQRLAICCSGGVDSTFEAVRRYVELLKPGGWIQFVEVQGWTAEVDGPAWKDFTTCLAEMIESIGSSLTHIDHAKQWLEELGLVNVEETVLEGNFGTREDKELEGIGKKAARLTSGSVLGVVKTLPQELFSVPADRIPQIEHDLAKELATDPANAHWHYKVVWGMKPRRSV